MINPFDDPRVHKTQMKIKMLSKHSHLAKHTIESTGHPHYFNQQSYEL